MSDIDLDRLGDLWRAQPDPAEMEQLQRTAATAARRARWGQLSDAALALVVSAVVLVLVWSNPTLKTALAGGGAILLMLVSTLHQRKLRKLELMALTGSSEEMLDQSIVRLSATRKRTLLGLIGAIPAIAIGTALGTSLESGGSELFARWRSNESTAFAFTILVIAAGILLYSYLLTLSRRTRAELDRLTALRDAYRRESEDSQG